MWIVAGILLGIVVLGVIAGFHAGPHTHVGAAAVGVIAAVWLVIMAALGNAMPLLYVLLGADVTITGVAGIFAWKVLNSPEGVVARDEPPRSVEGHIGRAVQALSPEGVVRVGGEEWTAVSLNGPVPKGGRVQVINARGVRLEVWGEDDPALSPPVQKDGDTRQ